MTAQRTCPKCGSASSDDALEGLCRKCLGGLAFGLALDGPDPGGSAGISGLRQLGDYELIEEIARGGMGVVYKARQLKLNRIVAVKVILHGPFSSPEFVQRFRTEAEAAARLHHPNIVAIHEVGEHDGHHYFSMEYIEGQDLAELVSEKPLPARRAAQYLKTIAEAVHYAHQQGILHRDLKPSNLLLDIFDQPRITDFGLAKVLSSDTELTLTGQVLGSPHHIPPEQAAGKFGQATPRSDVYSLGAILYHLVTGRPPFQGETLQEILLQVRDTEPVAPRRLNPSVPVDLQTICLKCLLKEPSRRYGTAKELAEDLGHFLANEPIHARAVAPAEKFWLWCRRRPVLAALSGGLFTAVMLGLAGILWQWRRAEQFARGELLQRVVAEEGADKLRLNLYAADVSLASQAIQRGDYGLARRTLAQLRPMADEEDLRGFEWRYLWNVCQGDQLATLSGHEWIVTCAAFSPDGMLVASGSQDGTAKIWDAALREPVTTIQVARGSVWSAAFSPDGKLLMTAGDQGVRLWNTDTWQPGRQFPGFMAAVSKTGDLLAASESIPFYGTPANKITLWNYRTGEKLRELDKPGRSLAFSPDGRQLAAAGATTGVDLWDTGTGRLLRALPTAKPVWSLAFSPRGNQLAAAGWSSGVSVWDLAGARPAQELKGHFLNVWSAAFSPDGATIATTGSDQTLRLWDAATLDAKAILRGHDNEVWCVAFSPDGELLVTGGKDQKVMLWPARRRATHDRVPSLSEVRPIFSPEGSRVLTATAGDSTSRSTLWSVDEGTPIFKVPEGRPAIGFSPDGNRVVTWNADSTGLEFWSSADGSRNRVPLAGSRAGLDPFWPLGFSPERDIFFAMDKTGLIRFWETASGGLLRSFQGPAPRIRSFALGPGARHLALTKEGETVVRLYERQSGRETQLAGHRDFVSGVAFSPDGRLLASGSVDGTTRVWDLEAGRQLMVLAGHLEEATDVAFSADGRTLASVGQRESVKFWHLATQRELLTLEFPGIGIFLQFSPDGRRLAVATDDNSIRLFRAPAFEREESPGR